MASLALSFVVAGIVSAIVVASTARLAYAVAFVRGFRAVKGFPFTARETIHVLLFAWNDAPAWRGFTELAVYTGDGRLILVWSSLFRHWHAAMRTPAPVGYRRDVKQEVPHG